VKIGLLVLAVAAACACAGATACSGSAGAPLVEPGGDAAAAADAPPDTDGAADAACMLSIDDAGVTHGCGKGGQGPGDHDDGGGMAAPPSDASPDASDLPFGASCRDNGQCATGMCFDFTVKGTFCTKTCSSNADCPAASPGCNGMGVCRTGG
jgi:hypothetical protein